MVYVDSNGEQWLNIETYNKYMERKKKYKEGSIKCDDYSGGSIESNKIIGDVQCELCRKRKAITRSYKGDRVCQNCNLEIIDAYPHIR